MNDKKTQESNAFKCQNGAQHYVCKECSDKHREREAYDGTSTVHKAECYICGETKSVGPSRKAFGFHRFS